MTGQAVQQDERGINVKRQDQRGVNVKKNEAPGRDKPTPQTATPTDKPELVLQTGHASKVDAIAFAPTGGLLASGGSDNVVKLWDAATGGELRALRGHGAGVAALAFSRDGSLLLSGSNDKSAKVWEVGTGRELSSLDALPASVKAVAFHPEGRLVAIGGSDNTVSLWDFSTKGGARLLGFHAGWVVALAFSPDGGVLASASLDGTVKLWNVAGRQEARVLRRHVDRVNAIAFSPDGATLASGSSDKTIKLWDVATGRERRILAGHESKIIGLAFVGAASSVISIGADRTIKLWDAGAGRVLRSVACGGDFEFEAAVFKQDGRALASSSGNKKVELHDAETGKALRALDTVSSSVYAVAFSPDFHWFASGNRDNSVKLWEVATGRELKTLTGHTGWITSLAFNPVGKELVSGSLDGTLKIWEAASGSLLRTLTGHADSVYAVAYSPDGRVIASGSLDGTVKVWDAATGSLRRTLGGHATEVTSVVFSKDGSRLISGSADKTIKFWDVATGAATQTIKDGEGVVYALALSPDGKLLASAGAEQVVKLRDAATGRETATLKGHTGIVNALAFSPDGRRLASASNDQTVKLWDVATGGEFLTLDGHANHVNALTFSPDGRWLISGSEDGSARLWEAATGTPRATLTSLRESTDWLVASPEGLFDGSPPAWNKVIWRFNQSTTNVAPVEIFFNEFYYPGLLAEILANRTPQPVQQIAQRDRRQPRLSLSAPGLNNASGETSARQLPVRIEVADAAPDGGHAEGSGALDLRLFRNGTLVKVWRGDVLQGKGKTVIETTVAVVAGENRLTAYAFNRDNVKSADAELRVKGDSSLARPGLVRVLAIGINAYANPQYDLRYAVADADSFTLELSRRQERVRRYERVEITRLANKDATRANILRALEELASRAQPEDAVIVYYAGHGIAVDDSFYLNPHDLGYTGPRGELDQRGLDTIIRHSLSDRALERAFEQVDAGQMLFVLDACNSGQALEATEKRRGPMNSKGLAQLAYEKGMHVLTASQSYQAAIEVEQLGHGLLTYVLVEEGLKTPSADVAPKDGMVAAREWLDFAVERVPRMQMQKMKDARKFGLNISFVEGEGGIADPENKSLQRPRVFYRREPEAQMLVVAGF